MPFRASDLLRPLPASACWHFSPALASLLLDPGCAGCGEDSRAGLIVIDAVLVVVPAVAVLAVGVGIGQLFELRADRTRRSDLARRRSTAR